MLSSTLRSGGREDRIEHQCRALPLHELQLYAASDPEAPVGCRRFSRSGITVADRGSDLLASESELTKKPWPS